MFPPPYAVMVRRRISLTFCYGTSSFVTVFTKTGTFSLARNFTLRCPRPFFLIVSWVFEVLLSFCSQQNVSLVSSIYAKCSNYPIIPRFIIRPLDILGEKMSCQSSSCTFSVFLGAFAKLLKATVNFVMTVCSSVRVEQLGSRRTDFHEIWYLSALRNSVEKIQFSLKAGKNNVYFTWRPVYICKSHLSYS